MWDAQIEALSAQYRVIAPDLRGFGQSSLESGDAERGVSMEQYADDLAELLDVLGVREPIVLVGFSMGGYIAWQFVRKYADRLRALVQCDTRAAADTQDARETRLRMADHAAEWGSARIAELTSPKMLRTDAFEMERHVVEQLGRVIARTSPAAIAAAQRGMAARPDVTSMLPTISVPTLIVVGAEDAISPPQEMRAIADAIPNAEYIEIPDAGHMTTMENPDAVNEALVQILCEVG